MKNILERNNLELSINPEYEKLVPTLRDDHYNTLKKSIKENGLWLPIVANSQGVILDGHHRYRACTDLGVAIQCVIRDFTSKNDEIIFVGESNLARRQMSDIENIQLVMKLEPNYVQQAKERMSEGGKEGVQNSAHLGKSRDKIAEKAYVSHDTYKKGKELLKSSTSDIIDKIKAGKSSINKEFHLLRKDEKREERHKEIKNLQVNLPKTIQLYNMDFQEAPVQANSVSLIFTDPPYLEKFLYLYKQLAVFASKVLKDGGSLITYVPQAFIPEICAWMTESGLNYHWIISVKHSGPSATIWNKKILVAGKVMLWFTKGKYDGEYVRDFIDSEYQGKQDHPWQQSTAESSYYIEFMTIKNEIICDPFLGSGKFGESAKMLKRQFIGIEIDPEHFNTAQKLLSIPT